MESINIPDADHNCSDNMLQSFIFDSSFNSDQLNDYEDGEDDIVSCEEENVNDNNASKEKKKPIFTKHKKFSREEDRKLIFLVSIFGVKDWRNLAKKMEGRNSRQCRERWQNYLNPNLNHSSWSKEEDEKLLNLREEHGPKWKLISKHFRNRTDAMIKNRYYVLMRSEKKKNEKDDDELFSNSKNIQNANPLFIDNNENNINQKNVDNNNNNNDKKEEDISSYFMNIPDNYEEYDEFFGEGSTAFGNDDIDNSFA